MKKSISGIVINIIYVLINAGALVLTRIFGIMSSSRAMRFSWYVMLLSLALHLILLAIKLKRNPIDIILTKKEIISDLFLSVIFVILLSFVEMKKGYSGTGFSQIWFWMILLVLLLDIFSDIYYVFTLLGKERATKQAGNRLCIICWILIFVESLLFILSAFPGLWIESDVYAVYYTASNNYWWEWHTIGYQWFVKLCISIWDSTYCVILVHTAFFLLTSWYVLKTLSLLGRRAVLVFTTILCVSVIPIAYLNIMIKDIVYFIGMLAIIAGVFRTLYTENIRKRDIAFLGTVPLFVTLCRHAGVAPVVITLFILVLFWIIKKNIGNAAKVLGIALWHVAIYILITGILTNVFEVTKNPAYIKYTMPMAMIGNAAASGCEFTDSELEILEKVMPIEDWAACYDPFLADTIARSNGLIGEDRIHMVQYLVDECGFGKDLIYMNYDMLVRYPLVYLRGIFDMTSMVWEMNTPSGISQIMSIANGMRYEGIKYSFLYPFTSKISIWADQRIVWDVLFTRGGFSLFVILFGVVTFILAGEKKYIIAFIPCMLNIGILMLSIPAQDIRYILPSVYTAIFIVAVLSSGKIRIRR